VRSSQSIRFALNTTTNTATHKQMGYDFEECLFCYIVYHTNEDGVETRGSLICTSCFEKYVSGAEGVSPLVETVIRSNNFTTDKGKPYKAMDLCNFCGEGYQRCWNITLCEDHVSQTDLGDDADRYAQSEKNMERVYDEEVDEEVEENS
jgi:hypothetical protein